MTYAALSQFLMAMVHANPGSEVVIDVLPHDNLPNNSVYKHIFWCIKEIMDGQQHARPVLSIDGTFLKGEYSEKLLIVICVNSNNHQYLICYSLVEEEQQGTGPGIYDFYLRMYAHKDQVCA